MVDFKSHSGLKVGETRLMLVRKVAPGLCVYAPLDLEIIEGCNGPMALVRELRRVTPDRCMAAGLAVTALCQDAASLLGPALKAADADGG
jgi:hypothetical protein